MKYLLLALALLVPSFALAQTGEFVPLTGLPGLDTLATAGNGSLPDFFNTLYKLCIGAAATIAVFNIMYAGFKALTLEGSVIEKGKVRSRITNSILGLILVLSPAIVFGVIDPRILNLDIGGLEKLKLTNTSSLRENNGIFVNGAVLYDESDEQRCASQNSCSVVEFESGGATNKYCRCESAAENQDPDLDPSTDIGGRLWVIRTVADDFLLVGGTIRRFPNQPGCVEIFGGVYQTRDQCTAARTRVLRDNLNNDTSLITHDCRVTEDREYQISGACVDQPNFQAGF